MPQVLIGGPARPSGTAASSRPAVGTVQQISIGYNANRAWEFSADADGDFNSNTDAFRGREFPPRFGSNATPVREYMQRGFGQPVDIYRPVLRKLLEVELSNYDQPRFGLRLNLNQLLVGPNGNPFPTFQHPAVSSGAKLPPNIQLNYRPLTPHPQQSTLPPSPITDYGTSSYPSSGNFNGQPALQEYWARIDRQLMARDLFCLLYTLCWADGINPTGDSAWEGLTAGPNRRHL